MYCTYAGVPSGPGKVHIGISQTSGSGPLSNFGGDFFFLVRMAMTLAAACCSLVSRLVFFEASHYFCDSSFH